MAVRLRERFGPAAAAVLAAASPSAVAVVQAKSAEEASAIAAAVRAAGGIAAASGPLAGAAADAAQFARAASLAPSVAPAIAALADAQRRDAELAPVWRVRDRSIALDGPAQVMGIVNVTPDSFFERVDGAAGALAAARASASAGAAIVDIGGRSYADGNPRIGAAEECARVVPAVAALAASGSAVPISIDTTAPAVAAAALAAGAHAINDCSGLADAALAEVVAAYDAGLVVMHLKGELNVRAPHAYRYADAMAEIVEALFERTERARAAGVARDAIAIDPGLEFGKEPETDLEILERLGELRVLGYPIVLASSRKSFMGRILNRPAHELLAASLATAGVAITAGARIVRTHDIAETVQFARMHAAIAARNSAARPAVSP